jgi:cytochrome b subunit of formate dehydrogenase
MASKFGFPIARPVEAYRDSVHARAVEDDLGGATCSNCHGSHDILPALDPGSKVFHQRVPETCGACHSDIAATYENSVHGTGAARGVRDAPVCSDCHGEHRVLSPSEPGSPAFPTNIPLMTCGHCHNDIRLTEKYGLPPDKIPTYEESYHGLAARAGSQTVAHCASCHGVHDILPSSDPRSHIHETNLAHTCGQCHPGAGERFAVGPMHVVPTDERFPVVYYIRLAYLILIFTTIGGMFLHNSLDFFRKLRAPPHRPPGLGKEERMMRGFRIAHGMVMISFFVLVYTGFALTYPEAWWAQPVLQWEADMALRGWLHRTAAVILMAALAFHMIHLARSRRARACITSMRPTWEDWMELKERVRYFLGRRGPLHGVKVGYVEKAEYLAFGWGMAIMAVTGLLLWLENFTLRWLPKWLLDAATAVHFYEAVLATLAILVWHFYWVIFDPAVYPMDTSWWGGKPPASRELERRPPPTSKPT